MFGWEKKRLRGGLVNVCNYLKRADLKKKKKKPDSSVVPRERTEGRQWV